MKRSELLFNVLSVPLDGILLLLAGILAFESRIYFAEQVGPIIYQLQLSEFIVVALPAIAILLVVFAVLGLYGQTGTRSFLPEVARVFLGVSVGLFMVMVLFFFNQTLFPSRFIILATWAIGVILVVFGRWFLLHLQRYLFTKGYGLHRLLVINGNHVESKTIEQVLNDKIFGYEVVEEIAYSENTLNRLEEIYLEKRVDEIMQANTTLSDVENLKILQFARNKGLQFSFVPNLFEVQRNVVEVMSLAGVPVIALKNSPLDGWGRVAKRLLDIAASSACLVITAPFFLAIYIAIKLDSPGRVIYPALRGGRGRDFWFYKFRTMYSHMSVGQGFGGDEAEKLRQELWKKNDRGGADGPFLKIKNDPRVTRVGKILRKTKLDEIPQFWNVLKGDMSMVGPRAHVLDEVDRYRNSYRRMFSIKPGIFGMSQIAQMGLPDLPFEEEVRLNTYYIENWSLWLDITILARSFYYLFFAKKPKEDY